MRIAYVDMVGGAAGDMLLAAFLDAGLDRDALERALRGVVAEGWHFAPERVVKRGIAATYAGLVVPGEDGDPQHVHATHAAHGTHLADVLAVVERSTLTPRQRERASAVYRRLAQAEATIHGTTVEQVHFHEVGHVDAILDVAATCIALDLLEIDQLWCSPFPFGYGTIRMAHGGYPNPAPVTVELQRGFATRAFDVEGELVTPTAAAILTTLAKPGPPPELIVERIGYGAGRSDFAHPNVTRLIVGTATAPARAGAPGAPLGDEVVVLEANIDDMSPQYYELAFERLFAAGARDVWLTPIVMKKGRPAHTLSALVDRDGERAVAQALLHETTTIGVRTRVERRYVAARESTLVDTPLGPVRFKRVTIGDSVRAQPEYDDVVRIARERGLPLAEVARVAAAAADARNVFTR